MIKKLLTFSIVLCSVVSLSQMSSQNNTFPISGNVGIGTTSPTSKLHLESNNALGLRIGIPNVAWTQIGVAQNTGNFSPLATPGSIVFRAFTQGDIIFTHQQNGNIHFANRSDNTNPSTEQIRMTIAPNGNVGIGKTDPTDKLEVNGRIHAKSVKVDLDNWPDYVFEKGYPLKSLQETEQYIKDHGHLENLPSREEVIEDGLDLGQLNKALTEKIEELTLHLIEKDREINEMQAQMLEVLTKVAALEEEKNRKL